MADKKLLAKNGADRVVFYTVKTHITGNAYTVCLLVNSEKKSIEARGISICSMKDTFNTKKGRNIACGRAIKALLRRENYYKINWSGRAEEIIKRNMKIKTDIDEQFFENHIAPELWDMWDGDPKIVEVEMVNSKYKKKYNYEVSAACPIMLANNKFKYKAEYRPVLDPELEGWVFEEEEFVNLDDVII